ncbi:MAG: BrnT family toxin [Paracoccaceae bacterium]
MNVEYELVLDDGSGTLTFEWDAEKDSANLKKHGISFTEAVEIFQTEVLTAEDTSARGELREISFGLFGSNPGTVVLCVIHTERGGNTRIISARPATKHERKYLMSISEKRITETAALADKDIDLSDIPEQVRSSSCGPNARS